MPESMEIEKSMQEKYTTQYSTITLQTTNTIWPLRA